MPPYPSIYYNICSTVFQILNTARKLHIQIMPQRSAGGWRDERDVGAWRVYSFFTEFLAL